MPNEAFREGRADVLRQLLALPRLFRTPYGQEHWEATARYNLRGELEMLSPPARAARLACRMHAVGAEQVEEAVADCVAALGAVVDRDWGTVRAGRLEWSCRRTAEHIASDLVAYAGQLAGRAQDAYVPFQITLDGSEDGPGPRRQRGRPPGDHHDRRPARRRDPHHPPRGPRLPPVPLRHANREGFAAMGVAEVLLHTHDIAVGTGIAYEPPAGLASFVLTRIFPRVEPGPTPWRTLLWATGAASCRGGSRSPGGGGATTRCCGLSG
ncbi:hypothetical protein GCM10023238_29120 [Streptomyces heliomycini]